jgi:hypothetical protein
MRSSQYIDILGEQFPKRTVLFVVGTVTIVVGGVVGLLYYLLLAGSMPIVATAATPAIAATPAATPTAMVAEPKDSHRVNQSNSKMSSQSSLVTLLEKHLEATRLSEVDSLIVHGTASSTAVTCGLIMMARRPNLYSLKTEGIGFKHTSEFGYNGQLGWFKPNLLNLSRDEVEFFMRVALFESSLAHLAWSYQSLGAADSGLKSVLEHSPDEQWQGRACAVIVSRGLLPFLIYHYIDLQSHEEIYRRTQVLRGTDLVSLEMHFAPSEAGASPRLPMGYELYFDGTLHDTIAFDKMRPNRMLFKSLFDAHSDATTVSLSPRGRAD